MHARFSHCACVLSTPFCEKLFPASPASLAGVRLKRSCVNAVQNLFEEDELAPEATIRKFRIVRSEGARQVARVIEHYNLEAILAADYQRSTKETTSFFKTIQNKFHFAATGETAAERFRERADASRPNMGLAVWKARWCTKSTSPWPNEQQSALPGMP